jgi:hypothetical protein
MKKYIIPVLSVLLFVLVFLFLRTFYPKNLGFFPVFILLYLLDLYLFQVYRSKIIHGHPIKAGFLIFLFWLPLLMIIGMSLASLAYPIDEWSDAFKTYYGGFIMIGYTSKLIPLALILLSDLIKVVRKIFGISQKSSKGSGTKMTRSKFIKTAGAVAGGLVFGSMTMGMFKWIYEFKIRKSTINLSNLPSSFNGFKIVQISDIHLGSWLARRELQEAVRTVNELNADVVFFTGDLVNYETDEAYPFEDILDSIEAKYGVYSVLGNHDYGDYKRWKDPDLKEANMASMIDLHARLGWKLLRNNNDRIRIGDEEIAVLGVENWGSMKRFQKYGDLSQAIRNVETAPVKLLLSHDPSHWQYKVSEFNHTIDITFSGHTHGAQFGIEIPGVRWSPSQYIYKYWAGLYTTPNKSTGGLQHLYVNRGLGAIGYPGRVGILPEITLIELKS